MKYAHQHERTGVDEYRFVIDAFTPLTLPMARLAEYVASLAELFAQTPMVHFLGVDEGSARLIQAVEKAAVVKVEQRLLNIEGRTASGRLLKAYDDLNEKLYEDNAVGELVRPNGRVIRFPGRERDLDKTAGPIAEAVTLDGEVIQVGGRDDTISVYLRDGDKTHICTASREQGRAIARFLFDGRVRVSGIGTFIRNGLGEWERRKFIMERFWPIDSERLGAVVSQLRALGDPLTDPTVMLEELRHGE